MSFSTSRYFCNKTWNAKCTLRDIILESEGLTNKQKSDLWLVEGHLEKIYTFLTNCISGEELKEEADEYRKMDIDGKLQDNREIHEMEELIEEFKKEKHPDYAFAIEYLKEAIEEKKKLYAEDEKLDEVAKLTGHIIVEKK